MIDATFVEIPRQRNNREDNALIKAGEAPVPWTEDPAKPMLRQKDLDARWTRSFLLFSKRQTDGANRVDRTLAALSRAPEINLLPEPGGQKRREMHVVRLCA